MPASNPRAHALNDPEAKGLIRNVLLGSYVAGGWRGSRHAEMEFG